MPMTRA